jgi:CheY-like chemotaxis protein
VKFSEQGYTKSSRNILIVEDDLEIRLTLRRFLEDSGYFVIEAQNGKEALRLLSLSEQGRLVHEVDLILTDLMMPVMGGVEFITELKMNSELHPGLKSIPVLVCSSSLGSHREMIAEVDGCIEKPIHFGTLRSKIVQLLREDP